MRIRRGRMAADEFTQISNALFRDPRISAKAKGLFGFISTHRDGWGITVEQVAAYNTDGVDSVKTGLRELEAYGYLERAQSRDSSGRLSDAEYVITDSPSPSAENPLTVESPQVGPQVDFPLTGEPLTANPPHKKTVLREHQSEEEQTSPSDADASDAETRPDVEHLCKLLADLIAGNGCLPPKITKAWRDECRRMLDLDKRDPVKAEALIRWSQANDFWRPNIRSMKKFRAHYDAMRLKALTEWERGQTPVGPSRTDRAVSEALARADAMDAAAGRPPMPRQPSQPELVFEVA